MTCRWHREAWAWRIGAASLAVAVVLMHCTASGATEAPPAQEVIEMPAIPTPMAPQWSGITLADLRRAVEHERPEGALPAGDGDVAVIETVDRGQIPAVAPPVDGDRSSWQLTEAEMREVLAYAGWPEELHERALAIAWRESRYSPGAIGDHGASIGLMQLNGDTWSRYCGVSREALLDPLAHLACAWQVYQYDLSRGQPAWWQWRTN